MSGTKIKGMNSYFFKKMQGSILDPAFEAVIIDNNTVPIDIHDVREFSEIYPRSYLLILSHHRF